VTIDQRSFNTNGTEQPTSHFDKSRVTPTASLIYKPVPWISTYASYIESLLPGTIVPTTGSVTYTNAGQMLPPIVSEQYEVGAKATLGGLLLTGALFYIDETNQYASTNADGTQTYKQDGRVIHDGVEFTATGKATANLTLFGGLTLMDCKVDRTSSPVLEDKTPTNVAEQMAKLYAEYAVPWVRGLTLTGGVYYTGTFYGDAMNTDKLPSVITGDVGARYTTTVFEKPVILRLNAMNVTNQSYWISTYYTGAPRTIAFSVQMKF
jgi:iron complex outermembrane receptor protein